MYVRLQELLVRMPGLGQAAIAGALEAVRGVAAWALVRQAQGQCPACSPSLSCGSVSCEGPASLGAPWVLLVALLAASLGFLAGRSSSQCGPLPSVRVAQGNAGGGDSPQRLKALCPGTPLLAIGSPQRAQRAPSRDPRVPRGGGVIRDGADLLPYRK